MRNIDVRQTISDSRYKHFEIAEVMGVTETSFSRMLRRELNDDQKEKIIAAIEELKGEESKC